jgi:hypothetical protein
LLSGLLGAMENGASASANRRASTASPAGAGGRRAPQLPAVSCRLARTACLPERPRPASRRRSRGAPGGDAATSATGVRVREAERGSIRTVQVEIEVEGLGAASGSAVRTNCVRTDREERVGLRGLSSFSGPYGLYTSNA